MRTVKHDTWNNKWNIKIGDKVKVRGNKSWGIIRWIGPLGDILPPSSDPFNTVNDRMIWSEWGRPWDGQVLPSIRGGVLSWALASYIIEVQHAET